jgi:hypothetical protein
MADKLSDIIKQQINDLRQNAPKPLTQAERDKIMSGRKKQADIDAGRAAIAARAKEVDDYNKALGDLNDKLEKAISNEGTEARRAEKEENTNPLTQKALPFAGGAVAGGIYGELANRRLDRFEKGNAKALNEIAREIGPTSKLTNSQMNRSRAVGAAKAAEKFMPATGLGKAAAVTGRALSYGIPAAAIFNEYERYVDQANDPNASESDKAMSRSIANGLLGGGTGIAVEGGGRFFFPARQPGIGQAMMRIEAARDFANRMDSKDIGTENRLLQGIKEPAASKALTTIDAEAVPVAEPQKTLPPSEPAAAAPASKAKTARPGDLAWYKEQARALEIPGRSKLRNKEQLIDAIESANRDKARKRVRGPKGGGKSAILAPLLAGGATYAMQGDPAEAGNEGSFASNAVNKLQAPAIAAGTAYGTNRLLSALKAAGQAAGGALEPTGAMGIDPLEGADRASTAENIGTARGQASYYAPWLAENVMGIPRSEGTAYDVTQNPGNMPVPSPRRPAPGNMDYPLSGDMANAESLTVAPPSGQPAEMDFDAQLADLERIFAELGGQEEEAPPPVQRAAQSFQIAQLPPSRFPQNPLLQRY